VFGACCPEGRPWTETNSVNVGTAAIKPNAVLRLGHTRIARAEKTFRHTLGSLDQLQRHVAACEADVEFASLSSGRCDARQAADHMLGELGTGTHVSDDYSFLRVHTFRAGLPMGQVYQHFSSPGGRQAPSTIERPVAEQARQLDVPAQRPRPREGGAHVYLQNCSYNHPRTVLRKARVLGVEDGVVAVQDTITLSGLHVCWDLASHGIHAICCGKPEPSKPWQTTQEPIPTNASKISL
jgi:hypothetical protein